MSRCLLAAFVCALMPLLTGTAIFFAWLWLRWDGFMRAGSATICAGLVLFGVGSLCLLIHVAKSRRSKPISFWQFHKASVVAGALLISNFPVAAAYTVTVIDIETRFYVTVENTREQQIESFIVTGGGVQVDFGPIAPKTTMRRSFHIAHDGELSFQTHLDGVESAGTIEGYVTNGIGGSKYILINSDNTIEVTDNEDRT